MEQKKTFKNLAEAFGASSKELQEHCLRVEQYADLIFMELCAAEEYLGNAQSRARLNVELRAKIGEAARYHDLGKVLVPDFYQWDSEGYSPEEQALYRKHGADGAQLVQELMQNVPGVTTADVNILAEAVGSHHERWDGGGWPGRTPGEKTPILGRIVAVADALDHRLMTAHSESPVEDVMDALMQDSGSRFDPVIMGLLYEAKRKVEKIFSQYAGQSRAIPKAPRIIRRKSKRPFYLHYRPITSLADQTTAAVEADMCFRRGRDIIGYDEAAHLLREKKDVQQLALMFILEAADAKRRMNVCQVGGEYIAINCVRGILRRRGFATAVAKLLTDTDSEARGLCILLTEEDFDNDGFVLRENCEKLRQLGFCLMLSGVALEKLDMEKLKALQVTHCRLPAMDSDALEAAQEQLRSLLDSGITLLGDEVGTYRAQRTLLGLGITCATGILPGGYMSEDTLITGELALVKN